MPGRPPFVAVIAILFAAGLPVALAVGKSHPDGSTPPTVQQSPAACETARETCATARANGREWRYGLLRASRPTNRTVIVDLGGPGVSVLSGTYHLGSYARDLPGLDSFNLLFIEEPWVTSDVSTGCRQAASAYYRTVRAGTDLAAAAGKLFRDCRIGAGQWGFEPTAFAEVVAAVAAKESLVLDGFIGHSFGSARYSYLGSGPAAHQLKWAILARPFPIGVDAGTFVGDRARLTRELFGNNVDAGRASSATARSLEVSAFDELSALVGLAYTAPGDEEQARLAVTRDHNAETIGRFSDNLWFRYGTDSISPAYLAQVDEVCAAMKSPHELESVAGNNSLSGVIASLMLPCGPSASRGATLPSTSICVITSKLDPVVAGDTALAMFHGYAGSMISYNSTHAAHNSRDGLGYCVKELVSPG
jgi:hypothetical protein